MQQILVSISQVHDLVLSTIKFHPISNVPALNVIQLFQQYRYSLCTAGASQLRAISKCHQLIPTFCSKTCLKNIVQDQKNARHASRQVSLWSLWSSTPSLRGAVSDAVLREHRSPATFCSLFPLYSLCIHRWCTFEVTSLPFPCSYFFIDLLSINLLNKFLNLLTCLQVIS